MVSVDFSVHFKVPTHPSRNPKKCFLLDCYRAQRWNGPSKLFKFHPKVSSWPFLTLPCVFRMGEIQVFPAYWQQKVPGLFAASAKHCIQIPTRNLLQGVKVYIIQVSHYRHFANQTRTLKTSASFSAPRTPHLDRLGAWNRKGYTSVWHVMNVHGVPSSAAALRHACFTSKHSFLRNEFVLCTCDWF